MKLRRSLKTATAWLVNVALVFGIWPQGAEAAGTVEQIYSWPTILSKTASEQVFVTKGVTYQKFNYETAAGPIVVHETWTNLDDPHVAVRTVMSGDRLENERNETVMEMARRTGAVTGINGDFFEADASGMALGMSVDQGQLIHHPTQSAVLGIGADNRVYIDKYAWNGQLTASNGTAFSLAALNGHPVSYPNGMVVLTPELGFWEMAANATVLTLKDEGVGADQYKVAAVEPAKTVVDAPYPGYKKVLAQGTDAINFVNANVRLGDAVKLSYGTSPNSAPLKYAIGGGPILLKNGAPYNDPHPPLPGASSYKGPITGVGATADGKRMLNVVVDGRTKASIGLTYAQMTNYLHVRGISDAMMLDGGGSTEMVVRKPGEAAATIANVPSDGRERRVANGLFVYSTAPQGQPTHVRVNGGQAVSVYKGRTAQVSGAQVRDEFYNPVANAAVTYSVEPATLGSIDANGLFTAGREGGTGKIVATSVVGGARGEVPVMVLATVEALKISPSAVHVGYGEQQPFKVQGTVNGQTFELLTSDVTWSVADASFGTVDAAGVFTSPNGDVKGKTQVVARLGNVSASASVELGYVQKTIDPLNDASKWVRTDRWGDVGTLTTVKTTAGSGGQKDVTALNYRFAGGTGVKQFVFYPRETLFVPSPGDLAAVNPLGIGVWVHGDNSGVKLLANFEKPDGTFVQSTSFVRVGWNGWRYVSFKLPSSAAFPLKLDYLDVYYEHPPEDLSGTLYFSELQTIYAASTYADKPEPKPEPPKTFPDIANHWGRLVIENLTAKGIVTGRDAEHFDPDTGLNRAEAVALIVRSLGLPGEVNAAFGDVPREAWYADEVGAAVKAGITNGVGDGRFAPFDPVNRNQMAKMIYSALQLQGSAPTGGTPINFHDGGQIAPWAKSEIDALSGAGLMIGDGTGYLHPVKVTTRAESAKMIHGMLGYAGKL